MSKAVFCDERGYVGCAYKGSSLFVEDRFSFSYKGTIRGFHGDNKTYKLSMCLYGEILLYVYDLRTKKLERHLLKGDDNQSVLIRPYTLNAHQCLKDSVLYYKWSHEYSLQNQWTVNYNDSSIGAVWNDIAQIVSTRDKQGESLECLLDKLNIGQESPLD